MTKNIAAALWMVNQAQAALRQEKLVSEKLARNLLHRDEMAVHPRHERLTIHQVSRETGVPPTTIRYWDKVGLISVGRSAENNYRMFTADHIRQILTIYALKFSVYSDRRKYSVERVKEELKAFDHSDSVRLTTIAHDIEQHLDQLNRAQIEGIAALYQLCTQVEANHFG